jgi:menaquinone-dependent protoporphyrinogen oxidase
MKIGIYFVSKHGQTREIATFLAAQLHNLGCDTLAIDLNNSPIESCRVAELDMVLVGAPVYQGGYPSEVRRFVEDNRRELRNARRTGFFSTCLSAAPGTPASWQQSLGPVRKFLDDLAWSPQWVAIFAGALNYQEYNPLVRWVLKKISVNNGGPGDTSRDYEFTRWDDVGRFAKDFANDERESPYRESSVPFATRTLNLLMPKFEQRLVQHISVRATPDEVGLAINSLNRSDTWFAEFLARVRNFGNQAVNPPTNFWQAAQAFGETAIHTGERHEVAGGLIGQFWKRGYGIRRLPDAEAFTDFREPGYTKVLTNFWFAEYHSGKTTIRTETRIHSLDPLARRKFRLYWSVVGIGIRLYMWSVLHGIRKAVLRGGCHENALAT